MLAFAGIFAGGSQLSKVVRQAGEEMQATVRVAGQEMRQTIRTAEDATHGIVFQVEQSAGNVVKLGINKASQEIQVVAGKLEQHAQVILQSASEKACFIMEKGERSAQKLMRMDLPIAARLVGAELVHGIGDALKMLLGGIPTETLMRSTYRMLCNPDATAAQVVEMINRHNSATAASEIFNAYKYMLDTYAKSALSTEEVFLFQIWFFAEAKAKLPPGTLPLTWTQYGYSKVGRAPDVWKPFRDSLVPLKHGALRERALACLDRVPATSEVGDRDVLLELTDIAYAVWRLTPQAALPAALPEPGPEVTDEMKKKLVHSLKAGRAQDVLTAVKKMMDLDSKSVIQTIQADEMVTLSNFLKFYDAHGDSEGAKPLLRAFAEKLKSRADRESSQEVKDLATHWRNAFPAEWLPFDLSNATIDCCNKALGQQRFLQAADILLLHSALQDSAARSVVDQLKAGDRIIAHTPGVFQLVYALVQKRAGPRLLECFNSSVVAFLDGSNPEFCICCKNYVLDGKGCEWSGGPGWFVDSKICEQHEKSGARRWRVQVHEKGSWFSFVTVEYRVLEGGRDDWSGGPSYYATTHPNPHGHTWPEMQWKLTPTRNGRFAMNCKYHNQRLNAEGRSWGYNKLRTTTEAGDRGAESDKEFFFEFF